MSRFFLFVCASLIFGVTAKPLNKFMDEAFQETVVSMDDNGKLSRDVEVEPPENMDWIHYEVDPSMKIWKSMAGQDQQPLKAEEDLDEFYHPSVGELLGDQDQIQNLIASSNDQAEPLQEDVDIKYSQDDQDDIDHPVVNISEEAAEELLAGYLAPMVFRSKVEVAEKNEDLPNMKTKRDVRLHLQPEEDMDHIYHKDAPMPVLQHDSPKVLKAPKAPVDVPFQRKYSEPEEDLDHLYHH
ncbi:uncharacterized protein si:ch211-217g15.3 [Cololabis saira]|uniref:uncharacterized protein si:ch211-217g15.3 n=1 Tax=Cololabis saira TaxID=129043 RepID=UPI002AD3E584|nr:uncharacterized protein si:ch211-217g15.3 [Cololabis saira]